MMTFFKSYKQFCFAILGVGLSYLVINSIFDNVKGFVDHPETVPNCSDQKIDRINIEVNSLKKDAKLIQVQLKNGYILETLYSSFIKKLNNGNSLFSAVLDAESNSSKSVLLESQDTFYDKQIIEQIIEDLVSGIGQIKMPNGEIQENFLFSCCKTEVSKNSPSYVPNFDFRCVIEDKEDIEILVVDKTYLLQNKIDIY